MSKGNGPLSLARGCMGLLVAVLVSHRAGAEVKALNNLVTELLEVSKPVATPHARYAFTNPREGWVFISSNAATPEGANAHLILDSENRDAAVIVHGRADRAPQGAVTTDRPGAYSILETMRHLTAGKHVLNVYGDKGATLQGLVVRAIPEIIYSEVGYWVRQVPGTHNPYTWEHLQSIGLPANVNVVLERHEDKSMDVQRWRAQGKKVLTHVSTYEVEALGKPVTADNVYTVWSQADGFRRADRDGIMFDELDGYGTNEKEYPAMTEAVRRLFGDPRLKGKVLYPYCNVMYLSKPSIRFVQELNNFGSKYTEDRYLPEQPTEAAARKYLKDDLIYVMTMHRQLPDAQKHMIMNLGYMSAPPESLNNYPGANYKVYLDMQFNLIANDPVFKDLYGLMCYHSAYADDEILRWSARLFRHYCIEGRKEMLSTDPYELPHIKNADFAEGATGWTLAPAEEGSMGTKSMAGYGALQGRYNGETAGDTFLWTKRSAKGPNRFSQQIRNLKPGRLYSLKLLVADYQELIQEKSVKEKHQVGIQIDNAGLVPYKSFQETYGSIISHGKFKPGENPLWSTYYFLVFRAGAETATLTLSDWVGDDRTGWPDEWGLQLNMGEWSKPAKPGGPIGQELMHNFIEVQPYLED
ncbi:MAG: hypothetical protein HY318_05590 [Armatimonadetes bacterium]|nr:hypothetical protein [Armatimonadota bacterium]